MLKKSENTNKTNKSYDIICFSLSNVKQIRLTYLFDYLVNRMICV